MILLEALDVERPIVFPGDPALDRPHRAAYPVGKVGDASLAEAVETFGDAWERYVRDFDLSVLPVLDGQRLTIYWVRGLTEEQVREMHDLRSPGKRISWAIAYGVVRVDDLMVRDNAGQVAAVTLDHEDSDAGPRLTSRSMQYFRDEAVRLYLWSEVGRAGGLAESQKKLLRSDSGSMTHCPVTTSTLGAGTVGATTRTRTGNGSTRAGAVRRGVNR